MQRSARSLADRRAQVASLRRCNPRQHRQCFRHRATDERPPHVSHVGGGAVDVMHQTRLSVGADMRFHAEEVLVSLLRLMHLRIALAFFVLGRAGRVDDGGVDNRALAQRQALVSQVIAGGYAAWFPVGTACDHRRPLGNAARPMPANRSTVPSAPPQPGNARDGFACAYRRTRNRKSSSDSWDGGLVKGLLDGGLFQHRSDGLCRLDRRILSECYLKARKAERVPNYCFFYPTPRNRSLPLSVLQCRPK